MRPRVLRLVVRAAASLSLALFSTACALFSLDLDALQSEGSEGGVADGAGPVGPSAVDAGGDAAGLSADGSSGDGSATPAFSCKSLVPAPTFCADFDTGAPVSQGWSAKIGTIELDSSNARSAPSSARVLATTAGSNASLRKDFSGSYARARLEVDVRLDPLAPVSVSVARLQLGGSILFLRLTPDGAFLAHDSTAGYRQFSASVYPTASEWFRLSIELDVLGVDAGALAAEARMRFDGVIVAERPITLAEAVTDVIVFVGIGPGKTSGADADLRYDNVVVQLD